MSLDKYTNLVQEINKLSRPRYEKNIFSLGGRGHYEDPITDILAFFIDPKEEHGFGVLFLRSLFQAANTQPPLLELTTSPHRELCTRRGNRIDLIAEGDSWLLVLENKMWHQAVNPFGDYLEFVGNTYKEKPVHYYMLLSIRNEKPPAGWQGVTWRRYIEYLKKNIGEYLTSAGDLKWHVIMREFLLNIESECGDESMSGDGIEFVRKNYQAIQEMNDMLKDYIGHMAARGMEAVSAVSEHKDVASYKQHNWGKDGIALRLLSREWGGATNVTLLLKRDGSLIIQFYVYDIPDDRVETLRQCIDETKYKRYWTEGKTIRCFGFYGPSDHNMTFLEIADVAQRLNKFLLPDLDGASAFRNAPSSGNSR